MTNGQREPIYRITIAISCSARARVRSTRNRIGSNCSVRTVAAKVASPRRAISTAASRDSPSRRRSDTARASREPSPVERAFFRGNKFEKENQIDKSRRRKIFDAAKHFPPRLPNSVRVAVIAFFLCQMPRAIFVVERSERNLRFAELNKKIK